jgi:alpha-tubulin suppressor-like RCC1 family protein
MIKSTEREDKLKLSLREKEFKEIKEKEASDQKYFIYSWGFGKYGQVGVRNLNYSLSPIKLDLGTNEIFQVSGGEFHSFVLTVDHDLYTFGKNTFGQLGLGHNDLVIEPIFHPITSKLKITQIYCGGEHTIALSQTNEFYSWGLNIFGQLGLGDEINRNKPELVNIKTMESDEIICFIAAGAQHSLISTNKNNIYTCGFGKNYALGHADNMNKNEFTKIDNSNILITLTRKLKIDIVSCGVNHSGCIIGKEYLIIWGKSEFLNYEKPTVVLSFSSNNSPSKIKQSGNYLKDLKIGDDFLLYLTQGNEVYSMGSNDFGQLGIKNYNSKKNFEKVEVRDKIKTIEVGYNFCIVTGEKNVYAWGSNQFGQILSTEQEKIHEPSVLPELSKIQPKIGCGGYHVLAFSKNNSKLDDEQSENRNEYSKIEKYLKKNLLSSNISTDYANLKEKNELFDQIHSKITDLEQNLQEKDLKLRELTNEVEEIKKRESFSLSKDNKSSKSSTKSLEYTRGFDNTFEISLEEIEFDTDSDVGKGTFGEVKRGLWRKEAVAVKFLKEELANSVDNIKSFVEECNMLKNLRHPNILLFMGACTKGPYYFVVTEFCENGNLFELLHQHRSYQLSWEDRRRIAIEIAQGMNYLHTFNPPILHRDLKSMNVLLDSYLQVKIADFGSTKFLEVHMTKQKGTFQWMAPEVIKYSSYTEKADIFSYGVIMNELAARSPPYLGVDKHKVAEYVSSKPNYRPSIPKGTPAAFAELMQKCWDSNPEKRPSFSDIIDSLTKMKLK